MNLPIVEPKYLLPKLSSPLSESRSLPVELATGQCISRGTYGQGRRKRGLNSRRGRKRPICRGGIGFGEYFTPGTVPIDLAAYFRDPAASTVIGVGGASCSFQLAFGIPGVGVDAVPRLSLTNSNGGIEILKASK